MDNYSLIKIAAIELESIDTQNVVKIAGLLSKLKNYWKKLWDSGYSSRYDRVKNEYSKIENDMAQLREVMDDIDLAISEADVSEYDAGVRKMRALLSKLSSGAEELETNVTTIAPPKEMTNRYNRAQYEESGFMELQKTPDERITITHSDKEQVKFSDVEAFRDISKDNIIWTSGAVFAASTKIIKAMKDFNRIFDSKKLKSAFGQDGKITPETIDAINEAILSNGIICHYFPKVPAEESSSDPKKLRNILTGQMEMGIKVDVALPNSFYILQLYIFTTDMKSSQRSAHKISIGKLDGVRVLSPNKSANSNIPALISQAKAEETILAVPGIENTTPEFRKKLIRIAKGVGTNPDWLAAVISRESAGTFDPHISSGINPERGAVGLIQFMPFTAAHLLGFKRTSKMTNSEWDKICQDARKTMQALDAITQLDYVGKFFQTHSGKLTSPEDVYMATFWPIGVGESGDFVIAREGSNTYNSNKNFDPKNTGVITKKQVGTAITSVISQAGNKRITVSGKILGGKQPAKQAPTKREEPVPHKDQAPAAKTKTPVKKQRVSQNETEPVIAPQTSPTATQATPTGDMVDIGVTAAYGPLETIVRQAIEAMVLSDNLTNLVDSKLLL